MTEKEREIKRLISYIRSCRIANIDCTVTIDKSLTQGVLNALEEIQQYREMENKLQEVYGECDGLLKTAVDGLCRYYCEKDTTEKPYRSILLTDEDADKWKSYKAIGTVEECRAAVEKQKPKKPVKRSFIIPYKGIDVCPGCKEPINKKQHHCKCGQAIDWSEEG